MTAAAIAGTFADFKLIRTRKLAQVIVEIPIEQADEALRALGGLPRSDGERWVAIARLESSSQSAPPASRVSSAAPPAALSGEPSPVSAGGNGTREKRKWASMKWVERFGILCEDRDFIAWATHHSPEKRWDKQHIEEYEGSDEEWRAGFPATYVRWWCGVDSRTKIDGNPEAEKRAQVLLNEWEAYTGRGSARP